MGDLRACLAILACAVTAAGCGGGGGGGGEGDGTDITYDFINLSSVTVTVSPTGDETFEGFALAPGAEKALGNPQIVGDVIDFSYSPAAGAVAEATRGMTIFRDP